MKTTFFFFLVSSFFGFSQKGAVHLTLLDQSKSCFYDEAKLVFYQVDAAHQFNYLDSTFTDLKGRTPILQLPAGKVFANCYSNQQFIGTIEIPVQAGQCVQLVVNPMTSNLNFGNSVELVKDQNVPQQKSINEIEGEEYGIDEVTITSLRLTPGVSCSVSSVSITRQDYASSASQFNQLFGTNSYNSINDISVRGARTDANVYFIDGVKTRSVVVPQSAISSVTMYTGGIPANYGDVTGGVFVVETKSANDYYSGHSTSNYGYRTRALRSGTSDDLYPEKQFSVDRFPTIYENMFQSPLDAPHSTFGIDVDRASWNYIRRIINQGGTLQRDAVKMEEVINAFDYQNHDLKNQPIGVFTERMVCPWNTKNELLAIHLEASELPQDKPRQAHQLVFLIDVSGSMQSADKLPLLQASMIDLVESLDERDRVAIVTYAGVESVALEPTTCSDKSKIIRAIENLTAGGSTNGMGGIRKAYELANSIYDPLANNRILLATDGDFNVGISDPKDLESYIAQQRGKGIYLTALGFGMGNYRNDVLETLADRGDGNHFYIGNRQEAYEALVKNTGNMINLARDVKLNVQFNPNTVSSYRLIGYENRLMPSRDFIDDTKDGGEMGYGHHVVALYEIELGKAEEGLDATYSSTKSSRNKTDIAEVNLRYKLLEAANSEEFNFYVKQKDAFVTNPLLVSAAAFGLELRSSVYKGTVDAALLENLKVQLGKSEAETQLKETIEAYLRNL